MTTKTALKSKIDTIYDEIDSHQDLTPRQRAAMRADIAKAIMAALHRAHDSVPGLSKAHREPRDKNGNTWDEAMSGEGPHTYGG
jgi:hypothetical protein